ncbi:hypothetical protein [Aureliella helgolandensis]|uniref:Uncharacterized protein n=1 Tax=Aureliella helgolandensis TaxID=2527968 RepID=A0A518G8S7_9BACT|nr:hypothetical protein [Aureliella helgolandensis]QDV25001.1 hypothetical protein Q31a_33230 [Aureliella helgolandensis]
MELQWGSHPTMSALHATWCLATTDGPFNPRAMALKNAAQELKSTLTSMRVQRDLAWEELLCLAPDEEGIPDFVARFCRKCGCDTDPNLNLLEHALRRVLVDFRQAFPKNPEEMRVRTGPLKLQWDARGPGLLHTIGRFTVPDLIVESARILLVQPILSGAGYVHFRTNRVHTEALLTDDDPELPEILRIAWMLAQLDFERSVYVDLVNRRRLNLLAGLAMLPAALMAADYLEMGHYSTQSLRKALVQWRVAPAGYDVDAIIQILTTWWETYDVDRPEWRIALGALSRLLDSIAPSDTQPSNV